MSEHGGTDRNRGNYRYQTDEHGPSYASRDDRPQSDSPTSAPRLSDVEPLIGVGEDALCRIVRPGADEVRVVVALGDVGHHGGHDVHLAARRRIVPLVRESPVGPRRQPPGAVVRLTPDAAVDEGGEVLRDVRPDDSPGNETHVHVVPRPLGELAREVGWLVLPQLNRSVGRHCGWIQWGFA